MNTCFDIDNDIDLSLEMADEEVVVGLARDRSLRYRHPRPCFVKRQQQRKLQP